MKIRTSTDGFKEGTVTIFSFVPTDESTTFQWILPNCSVVTQTALVKFSGSQKHMDMDVGKGHVRTSGDREERYGVTITRMPYLYNIYYIRWREGGSRSQ